METSSIQPFWGAQTSYLNFCEEDYVVTRYIAEFINTLSSLAYVAFGIYGLINIRQTPRSSIRLASYFGLIGVGLCSAGYHMTLKYHTQMSDELSMHLLTTPLLYRILTFKASPQRTQVVGLVLSILFTIVMVTHMVMDEFLLHASTFGLSVYLIVTRIGKLIPQQISDPVIRKRVHRVSLFGTFNFVFGYLVWLIDDWACQALTNVRHSVGLPLAFFLELHGWWHIFTAIGGYIGVALVDALVLGEVTEDPIPNLAWPVPFASRLLSGTEKPAKKT
ncbi:Alkaline ceramidase YPC1-like protein [Cladobotryum mycophilum]|uniref:Alkaline ceramidase YPC1-like protein n=1 Tax=Cladobotryum mycophilum TaxID=491253 RepID=A0ABR0SIT3_9HYPO